MPEILSGLALRFFRGIGPEIQRIGPFRDFNFFIGPNNAGKSTILDFLCAFVPFPEKVIEPRSGALDRYRGTSGGSIEYQLMFRKDDIRAFGDMRDGRLAGSTKNEAWEKIVDAASIGEQIWLKPLPESGSKILVPVADFDDFKELFNEKFWANWSIDVSGQSSDFKASDAKPESEWIPLRADL